MAHSLRFLLGTAAAFSTLLLVGGARAEWHEDPPPKTGLLLRADLSVVPGYYSQQFDAPDGSGHYESSSTTLGPNVALNLGIAPAKLLRIGIQASSNFGMSFDQGFGIPSTQLEGLMRWTIGPTVGFRFGPSAPLELEFGAAFTQMKLFGSQAFPADGSGSASYQLMTLQNGVIGTVLLIWRPFGAASKFGLHAGGNGGWATSSEQGQTDALMIQGLLGISIGL